MAGTPQHESQLRLRGQVLLATPSLRDGIFDRSVIYLAEHDSKDGAYGLILNRPIGQLVGELLTDAKFEPLRHIPVHFGGPVSGESMTFSAFWWSEENGLRSATRISAGDAIRHARQPGTLVRAFVGYSGWSGGQLEGELRRDAWFVSKAPENLLAVTHDRTLWSEILRGISPYHRLIAEAPEDPFVN
jgi:putative transcriptional regulator